MSLSLSLSIYIYIYTHMYMYTYMYICIHTYVIHTCTHVYMMYEGWLARPANGARPDSDAAPAPYSQRKRRAMHCPTEGVC